jgi:hypothetical protein
MTDITDIVASTDRMVSALQALEPSMRAMARALRKLKRQLKPRRRRRPRGLVGGRRK